MLNQIIKFSISNKLVIGLVTLLLIIWGVWSASKLPIDAVPDITNNQVQIITVCPSLAGQEVEQLVTFPIEQSIANLPQLEETRSISRFGLSVITLVFSDDVDIYFARQLIHEKITEASENIPRGIGTPELAPVSTGLGEVYQYIIHPKKGSESKYNAKDLRTMQDWIVARQLRGTPGIAEVNSFGGELKQYEVAVNPNRLKAMGVSITDIFLALEHNNQNTGGAYIDKKPNAYFIRGVGLLTSLEDVKNIAIKNTGIPIFIKDAAEVRFGSATRYGALTYNGEVDAVGGVVMMLKGENSNELVNKIKEKLPTIQKSLPEDIVIEPYLDRTVLVKSAMSTVERNLIEGALIVIFVLVLFLGNFRAGLIVASAIPLSMLFALGLMHVFKVSANLMSLGAIDFGLIVDGAVIIVEATLHHLGLRKDKNILTQEEMDTEIFQSASKIRNSAAFGEIIILIVYIPILSLVGIEGKMFRPMAQTVSFAILGALLLSITYIPMMCSLFLSKKMNYKQNFSDKMMIFMYSFYQPLLTKLLKIKYLLVGIFAILFFISLYIFSKMGGEFIPTLNEGDFAFHCILPQGSSLSQSIETSMQASRIIKDFDEVKMVIGKTGAAEVPTDPMPPEATDMMIILKPPKEWKYNKSYEDLADEMMEKLEIIPGIFFEKNQPIQMRFNELMTGIREDVAVKIFGENLDSLFFYANQVSHVVSSVSGVTKPQVERITGLPQINIEYDRARIANYGLNIENINDIVSTAFAGKTAGVVYENERKFDLVVRLDSNFRSNIDDVVHLLIPTHGGHQIPLSQLADVSYKLGPAQISRESGKRRIVIGFNVKDRDVQSIVEEIHDKLSSQINLPSGYYFTYGGTFENLQKASNRLMIAVPIALFLILFLLYFTFRSMRQTFLIFTAIPMSAIGGVFALLMRGMPFSISAGIGFIALFGVAVLNGIVLISTFNTLEKEGWTDLIKRVMEGTKIRLRPVLMTAMVASLGFLPMALSTGAGAEVQKPLATVVIGGLITATFLTLFVLPALYIIFNSKLNPRSNMKIAINSMLILCILISAKTNAQTLIIRNSDDAINIALKNNLSLKESSLQVQAQQALQRTAFELPKLALDVQLGQFNSNQFDNAILLSQTIPFPTVFKAKKELLRVQTESKEVQIQISKNELKKEVRNYYSQIEFYQNNQTVLWELDSLYNEFIRVAQLKYKTGETSKIEFYSAETRKGEINLLMLQNQVFLENAYQHLKVLLNTTDSLNIIHPLIYSPIVINEILDTNFISIHPSLQALEKELSALKQSKKVEKAIAMPDFSIAYNNQSITGVQTINNEEVYFDEKNRFSSVSLGISIPISYGTNKAKLKSLEYQIQARDAHVKQQELLLSAQLKNILVQYKQDVLQFNYYRDLALPKIEETVKAAQLGYRTGEISYVEYLYTLQTAKDMRLNYLKSILQINQSAIAYLNLTNQ